MYQRVAAILFPIALVLFLAAAAWGYMENQDKNAVLIKAENQYQRAFHDLNDHMEKLNDELGKTLAINSRRHLCTSMTNVWRLTYSSREDVSQLPLTLMPFNRVEQFLARVGTFAYEVGVRDLNEKPLTEKEWMTLNTLYNQSQRILSDLQTVQAKMLNGNLRWMDVEMAIASEDKKMDNNIIDGFRKVNRMVEEFPEVDWGPTVNNMEVRKRERNHRLTGAPVTAEEAKRRVADFLDRDSTRGMSVTRNHRDDFQTYSVRTKGKRGEEIQTDLTEKGGQIVWMVYDRTVTTRKLDPDMALLRAERFLERKGYQNMAPISWNETGNIASFTFVRRENGVWIYPETLAVKVALDNGEIMGFQADEYVFNHIGKINVRPRLSEAQARKGASPRLRIQKSNLAVIFNQEGREVLCYEFLGTIGQNQYRIFINANDGEEEYVEKIEKADADRI